MPSCFVLGRCRAACPPSPVPGGKTPVRVFGWVGLGVFTAGFRLRRPEEGELFPIDWSRRKYFQSPSFPMSIPVVFPGSCSVEDMGFFLGAVSPFCPARCAVSGSLPLPAASLLSCCALLGRLFASCVRALYQTACVRTSGCPPYLSGGNLTPDV